MEGVTRIKESFNINGRDFTGGGLSVTLKN